MPKLVDMTGAKVGRLTVIRLGDRQGTSPRWLCQCECGKETLVQGPSLRTGRQKSCGCLRREVSSLKSTTHGLSHTAEASIWNAMKQRCYNPKHVAYLRYSGRGIQVCERWLNSFEDFLKDMGPRPSTRHTIERNDGTKGYQPDNCRWATYKEQCSNTSRNVYVFDGDEKVTVTEWARRHGVNVQTAFGRYRRGVLFSP